MKLIRTIYWALALGQIMVGVVSYVLISTGTLGPPDYTLALLFQEVALILVPVLMAAGYFIFRFQLSKIDMKLSLDEKLKKYFSLVIVRGALFEAAFLYCCVAALTTRVMLFLWMAPVVFIVFLMVRPSVPAITNDLQLSPDESNKINR